MKLGNIKIKKIVEYTLGILLTIAILVGIYLIIGPKNVINFFNDSNNTENGENSNENGPVINEMLVGTYRWNKTYTNDHGKKMDLKIILVLNDDGTATYEASDGYSFEPTKGTYKFEDNKIIYTKEYYNYPDQENTKYDKSVKIENFEVIDDDTLQNIYSGQLTSLKKQVDVTAEMLVGTYKWNKTYTNDHGKKMNLKITLILNNDGTAVYEASDGYSYEATRGTYKFEYNKVIYTREYYNYPNQENTVFDDNNKTETFEVINSSTLQNTFNSQLTSLQKQNVVTREMLIGTYKWSKVYTNDHGKKLTLKILLILNNDGTAIYEASDGYSYEATKGTFKFENYKIMYTREYYNYLNQENTVFDDENNKLEIFEVINRDSLQNIFNNQLTDLRKQDEVTKEMLVGTYKWNKTYTNERGKKGELNVVLVLSRDGTATYEASDGYSYEATKGTYKFENYKVIYTREYYNYPNQQNDKFDDENNKTEIFEVINSSTLQNTFNDQLTELKK